MSTRTRRAHTVPCPGCHAVAGQPCTTLRGRAMDQPHPRRAAAWARESACCPECQVTPGVPCRTASGAPMPFRIVHHRRYQEAEAVA
ncbi:zinc finger domain-containing protein [Streptomyces europaeiscabiei]|uniref:zinc finger domain-containing protein n=1 Tax=Streptomyces europaeiscabiei TaxID=146819 RepID=UPI000E680575|nr:hypothetical protein [Streptomyces europaeiscabiei]